MGAASAVREIVKERPIYQRERSIGLSSAAYLWSKVVVLSVVVTLQALAAHGAGAGRAQGCARSAGARARPILEIAVAVVALTIVSAMLGLVISAWVNNADKAMPMLVLMIMVQLVFSGGLVPLAGRAGLKQVSYVVPSRWGFAMTASTVDLRAIETIRAPQFCAQLDQAKAARPAAARSATASMDGQQINQICHHRPPRVDADLAPRQRHLVRRPLGAARARRRVDPGRGDSCCAGWNPSAAPGRWVRSLRPPPGVRGFAGYTR